MRDLLMSATTSWQGVRTQVKIADLHGWTRFFCEPWSHKTKREDLMPPSGCGGNALLMGAKKKDSDALEVAAMGLVNDVTRWTESEEQAVPHNGAFWYCVAGKSLGFADSATIRLNRADNLGGGNRLSWHLGDCGGWRCLKTASYDVTSLEKVLFYGTLRAGDIRI